MYDFESMRVFDTGDDLLEELASTGFGHTSIGNDVVEEFASCIFQHEYDICRG